MSSLRRRLCAFLLAALLIPAFSAGKARAQGQCQGMQRGGMSSRQSNAMLRSGQQGANLRTTVPQGSTGLTQGSSLLTAGGQQQTSLQATTQQQATLQAAVNQATALLNTAQQQGASQSQINQLTLLQQQLTLLLAASQQQAAAGGLALTR
jgi:hypothetical protein